MIESKFAFEDRYRSTLSSKLNPALPHAAAYYMWIEEVALPVDPLPAQTAHSELFEMRETGGYAVGAWE